MRRIVAEVIGGMRGYLGLGRPRMPQTKTVVQQLESDMRAAAAAGLNQAVIGRKRWTWTQFEIVTTAGVETTEGWVRGYFSLSPSRGGWILSHLSTGYALLGQCSGTPLLWQVIDDLSAIEGWEATTPRELNKLRDRVDALLQAYRFDEALHG